MLTRWRKVWTDLWVNKTRTLLMVSTIIVGVFSIGLVNNLAIMMNNDMESDYLSSNPSHAKIYVSPIADDWVRNLRNIPGVADTEGRIQLSGKWTNPEGKRITILFSTVKSIDKMRLDQLKPAESGGLIPELRRQDVLFDRSAKALGFKPDDSIVIEIPGGEKRSLHFVDYVHDVTTIPYNMSDVITGYVNQETADYFGSEKDYNQLLVSVSENTTDRVHVSNVIKKITDRMEDNGIKVTGVSMYGVGHHFAWEITQGVIFILTFFGWMTIVLSGFLIINTIIALMLQQTRQVGIMKAIGAGAEQIFPMYLALLICFGGAAFIISFPLAAWVSSLMGKFMADFLNYDAVSTGFFPNVILLQAVVAILTPILAAMLPVINSLRVPVREALNSYGLGGSSQKITQAESRLSFIPRPILLSLRNAFRKKTRLALTLCTLIMAGGIFIAVFNLWISFDQLMQDIQGYFLADINVVLTHNYPAKSIKSVVQAFPGVESVEGWMSMNGVILAPDRIKEDAISFIAPPSDSKLIRPSMVEGRWLQPGDKNVIVAGNQLQKIRPDLKLNDWVEIKINNKRSKWQIIGFYRLPGNIDPPLLYTSYEYLSYLVGMPNQVAELRFTTYEHDAVSQSDVSRELQSHLKKNKIDVIYLQTASEWFQQQKSQTDVLAYIMLMMACLIAVVGGLGLTNTMSLNLMERTREIGVMRAIGATNSNIQSIVVIEAIVIGIISWVLGIGLSIPITYLLDYGVGIAIFQSPLNVTFSWTGSFAWLLGMLLITTLSSIAPAARASKLSVRETLAYE